jgi:hypothetical protein
LIEFEFRLGLSRPTLHDERAFDKLPLQLHNLILILFGFEFFRGLILVGFHAWRSASDVLRMKTNQNE